MATRRDFAIDESVSFSFLPQFLSSHRRTVRRIKERERERVEKEERFYRVQGLLSTGSETALPTVITRYTHPDIISTNSKCLPIVYRPSRAYTYSSTVRISHPASWQSRYLACLIPLSSTCRGSTFLLRSLAYVKPAPRSVYGEELTSLPNSFAKDDRWRFEEIYSFLERNSGSNIS